MATSYGSDISTFSGGVADLDPTFAVIDGDRVVLESVARRLMTPAGFFDADPEYGLDLTSMVGMRMTSVARLRVAAQIEGQALREERVRTCKVVTFESSSSADTWRLQIRIDVGSGPFTAVLGISNVTVSILQSSGEN